MRPLIFIIYILLSFSLLHGQKVVEGYVYEKYPFNKKNKNIPISDVSIVVKGGTVGTLTDKKGYFRLENIDTNFNTIIVTHLNFKTIEVDISEKDFITVYLAKAIKCFFLYPYLNIGFTRGIKQSNYGIMIDKGFGNFKDIPIETSIKISYRSNQNNDKVGLFKLKKYHLFNINSVGSLGTFFEQKYKKVSLKNNKLETKEISIGIIPQLKFIRLDWYFGYSKQSITIDSYNSIHNGIVYGVGKYSLKHFYFLQYKTINWGNFWQHQIQCSKGIYKSLLLGIEYEKLLDYEEYQLSINYWF